MPTKNRLSTLLPKDPLEIFDSLFPIFLIIIFFLMSFTFCIGSNTYDINIPDPTHRTVKVSVQGNIITEQILSTTAQRRWNGDYFVHRRLLPFFRKIYASLPFPS